MQAPLGEVCELNFLRTWSAGSATKRKHTFTTAAAFTAFGFSATFVPAFFVFVKQLDQVHRTHQLRLLRILSETKVEHGTFLGGYHHDVLYLLLIFVLAFTSQFCKLFLILFPLLCSLITFVGHVS